MRGAGFEVADDGPVVFADIPLAELFGESRGGFAGAGDDRDAGNRFIESADDAEEDVTGLLIFGADIVGGFQEKGRGVG